MVLKKVALTGASGMVGRHVIPVLSARAIRCAASSRHTPAELPVFCSWTPWDLRNWKTTEELDAIFPDVDALLHLGALVPKIHDSISDLAIFETNVRASLCLAQWALGRDIPMVYLSSSTVYAEPEHANIVETDQKTTGGLGGFYGFSKLLAEELLQYYETKGLHLCILRPSSIYGFGLPEEKMISSFLIKASKNEKIELTPPVEDAVDLIHAADVAEVMLAVLEKGVTGVFNIASEKTSSVSDIAKACVDVVGKGKIEFRDAEKNRKPVIRFALNCAAARFAFSFSPKISLNQGIEMMWLQMKNTQGD